MGSLARPQKGAQGLMRLVADDRSGPIGAIEAFINDVFSAPKDAHGQWLDTYFGGDREDRREQAMLATVGGGSYLMIDPRTREPLTMVASAPPVFTPELAQEWHYGEFVPPTAEILAALPEIEKRTHRAGDIAGRRLIEAMERPLLIRYPNGELHVTRHREGGSALYVGGSTPLELPADEAEALGLAEWMPFTRPKAPPHIEYAPPRPPRRGGLKAWIAQQAAKGVMAAAEYAPASGAYQRALELYGMEEP